MHVTRYQINKIKRYVELVCAPVGTTHTSYYCDAIMHTLTSACRGCYLLFGFYNKYVVDYQKSRMKFSMIFHFLFDN